MKALITGIGAVCALLAVILLLCPGITSLSPDQDARVLSSAYGGTVPSADTEERILAALKNKRIANPIVQRGDPYLIGGRRVIAPPQDHAIRTAVCGVRYLDPGRERYEIRTLRDKAEAAGKGYRVTHGGYCGTCSTLQDLAVYLQRRDMTYAVRSCSFKVARGPILSCLEKIGFSRECALTWYYNIQNTGRQCLGTCLASWMRREPLNRADGSLNACLQCDEDRSGPIFKYWAGRTRRNSGIRSEIERRGDELYPVTHDYY
jgi:hypothetical protein